ncbi:hypothetical protein [Myxococcus phage Mx1]|nr:hypothetical protein [Myxococcus phage Mx1]
MKPGTYVLNKDVANPKPDRRLKYDWRRAAVWEKGQRFQVNTDSFDASGILITWTVITLLGKYQPLRTDDDSIQELVANLSPIPEKELSLEDVLVADGQGAANRALHLLVRAGKLTVADVAEALKSGEDP